ncbi:quinolinate synthase NadA [Formicincola oecophyllae]|uniref:quinolinate synthase NadA n=1 Tax=Formicincola oecophyllae TaxID=2558361 RepID=UPI00143D4996|nr:quinolinate synthase NadA [Formicincola oecophyllae]
MKQSRHAVLFATPDSLFPQECASCDYIAPAAMLLQAIMVSTASIIMLAAPKPVCQMAKLIAHARGKGQRIISLPHGRDCNPGSHPSHLQAGALLTSRPNLPLLAHFDSSLQAHSLAHACCSGFSGALAAATLAHEQGVNDINFLGDSFLAHHIQTTTGLKVHRAPTVSHPMPFTPWEIRQCREAHPGIMVVAHHTATPEIQKEADVVGNTSSLMDWFATNKLPRIFLAMNFSMTLGLPALFPHLHFVRALQSCRLQNPQALPDFIAALEGTAPALCAKQDDLPMLKACLEPVRRYMAFEQQAATGRDRGVAFRKCP